MGLFFLRPNNEKNFSMANDLNMFPDKLLAAIGNVTVRFSILDFAILVFIRVYFRLNDNEQEKLLEKYKNISDRIFLMELLAARNFRGKNKEKIEELIREIKSINSERNRYMHDFWAFDKGPNEMIAVRSVLKSETMPPTKLTAKQIEDFSARPAKAAAKLLRISIKRVQRSARAASANKSRSRGSQ